MPYSCVLQADQNINVVYRKESSLTIWNRLLLITVPYLDSKKITKFRVTYNAIERSFEPVVVYLVSQIDDVTFAEAQFTLVLGIEVVERSAARLRTS